MNKYSLIFQIGSALIFYFLSALLYSGGLYSRYRFHGRYASLLAGIGFLIHSSVVIIFLETQGGISALFSNLFGSIFFFGWVLIGTYLLIEWRYSTKALGAVALPVGVLTVFLGMLLPSESTPIILALYRHPLAIQAHIFSILLGYASFTIAFCAAIIYLAQHRKLKTKELSGMFERLPALSRTDELAARMVVLGYPLLTLGLALGVTVAFSESGIAWIRDPKVITSMLVWLVFSVYLVARLLFRWSGRKPSYLLILGFSLMILTYLGGILLGPGLHGSRLIH